mgnify:FL=1|tara:strand:- start:91 stop:513 length:423 start_codon:yes stop_codon:yes gene_type:complete
MSSNKLMYDTCEYKTRLNESTDTLEYLLDPIRYENCNKCRTELGLVGGSGVSQIKGNLVDLEGDLFGITRKASLCPTKKYNSACATGDMNNCNNKKIVYTDQFGKQQTIDTSKVHLPSCNMIRYKPIPLPPQPNYFSCGN